MVWFSVRLSVFVWVWGSRVVISPCSVVSNFMVRVGLKVWWIRPAGVSAFMVNVGVISRVYVVVRAPISVSIAVFILSSSVLFIGGRGIWIWVWVVVVCGVV